jgi:uncharacterized protein (DUF433 family)
VFVGLRGGLKDHRINLYHVISVHVERGLDAEQLHDEYPTLTVEELKNVLEFYRQNRGEVDDYVRAYREDLDRQEANAPRRLDWDDMRKRWEKMKQAKSG